MIESSGFHFLTQEAKRTWEEHINRIVRFLQQLDAKVGVSYHVTTHQTLRFRHGATRRDAHNAAQERFIPLLVPSQCYGEEPAMRHQLASSPVSDKEVLIHGGPRVIVDEGMGAFQQTLLDRLQYLQNYGKAADEEQDGLVTIRMPRPDASNPMNSVITVYRLPPAHRKRRTWPEPQYRLIEQHLIWHGPKTAEELDVDKFWEEYERDPTRTYWGVHT